MECDCKPIFCFELNILFCSENIENARHQETMQNRMRLYLLIFSPFANPDNSNFSSFMSTANYVDLDLIGEPGWHTETNRGVIAFICRDVRWWRTCPSTSRWSPDGGNCSMTSHHPCPASASWWLKTISDHWTHSKHPERLTVSADEESVVRLGQDGGEDDEDTRDQHQDRHSSSVTTHR